jgi:hypothetical protein
MDRGWCRLQGVDLMAECELRRANGEGGTSCDEGSCMYWRFVDGIGVDGDGDRSGCAIQYFQLLGGGNQVAAWLLSVKQRVESTEQR